MVCSPLTPPPQNILFILLQDAMWWWEHWALCVMATEGMCWVYSIQEKMSYSTEELGEVWHLWGRPTSPYLPFKSEDGHLESPARKVRMKTGPGLIKPPPPPIRKAQLKTQLPAVPLICPRQGWVVRGGGRDSGGAPPSVQTSWSTRYDHLTGQGCCPGYPFTLEVIHAWADIYWSRQTWSPWQRRWRKLINDGPS